MRNLLVLGIFLVTGCKAGKPELMSLNIGGSKTNPSTSPSSSGNGRMVVGSQQNPTTTPNFKIRGRVATTPQTTYTTTPNYIVRGHVDL